MIKIHLNDAEVAYLRHGLIKLSDSYKATDRPEVSMMYEQLLTKLREAEEETERRVNDTQEGVIVS